MIHSDKTTSNGFPFIMQISAEATGQELRSLDDRSRKVGDYGRPTFTSPLHLSRQNTLSRALHIGPVTGLIGGHHIGRLA